MQSLSFILLLATWIECGLTADIPNIWITGDAQENDEGARPRVHRQAHSHSSVDPNWVMPTLGSTPRSRAGKTRRKEGQDGDKRVPLDRVEIEPGIHDRVQEGHSFGGPPLPQEEIPIPALLQRLNEHLATLASVGEQQLRRLETMDYRLTKLEVQAQEKSEGVRAQVAELLRKMDTLDYDLSKTETLMDVIRQDVGGLRQGHTEIRMLVTSKKKDTPDSSFGFQEGEVLSKLQMVMATLYSMRGMAASMNDDLAVMSKNMTLLVNATRHLRQQSDHIVTKQYLRTVLLDNNNNGKLPIHSLPHYIPMIMSDSSQTTATPFPIDCWEIQQSGQNKSGIYQIRPQHGSDPFFAYCDMETRGGGWLVFHNRMEGTVDFYRDWQDYKYGFGNIGGEFWLGLEKLHLVTNQKVYEILIDLQDFTLATAWASYSAFAVGSEVERYPIILLGSYEGDAGDSLAYHAGMKFSTHEMDNDLWLDGNCAQSHSGAWWYNGCDTSNLNGRYLNGNLPPSYEYQGMYWYDWHGPSYSLFKARMMVRPKGVNVEQTQEITKVEKDEEPEEENVDLATEVPEELVEETHEDDVGIWDHHDYPEDYRY